jgi:hypothetical protein
LKKVLLLGFCFIALLLCFVYFYKTNYTSTIEEAANKANIQYDEIYQAMNIKNRVLVFYGLDEEEVFSVGVLKKDWLGYKWIMGSGSAQVNNFDAPVSLAMANLPSENRDDVDIFISVAFGTIYQNEIEKLNVIYEEKHLKPAVIIETKLGRKWFSLSDNPISGDPQIIGLNKDGAEIFKNY